MGAGGDPTLSPDGPIGVFDSGVGGLSILREIALELPPEQLIYVADSRFAPYGDRSESFITARSHAIVEFLTSRHAKAVVVACNTATSVAIASLRERFRTPIIGIEPAVKPAAGRTRSGVVGVLATSRTLAGPKFVRLLAQHGHDVRVLSQPCPGLVERIESGDFSGSATRALVETYVRPLIDQGADTIVLGCTHYGCLLPLIRSAAGEGVEVLDPARPVARELIRRLDEHGLRTHRMNAQAPRFFTSGEPSTVGPILTHLWGANVLVERLPGGYCGAGQP